MKYSFLSFLVLAICLINLPVLAQTEGQTASDTATLGLPGDNLDLYGVLNLFQKSKTIEEFEKTLNEEKTGLNNLDLNLDQKVDFIKVTTKQKDDDFSFILQIDVAEKEIQDVAVILLDKDKDGKMTLQIVGDEELYGKNYVIEPKTAPTPSVTANPAYAGDNPVTVSVPASTTVVVVETIPVVQYVYSPVYVPYTPPYYYGYYPPYYAAFTVMAVGIYRHNNYYHHGGYYGGHYGGGGGNVYIHNENNFNNYNNSRNKSNTVANNKASGNYNSNRASTRQSGGTSATNRAATTPSTRQSGGTSASNRAATTPSTRQSGGTSASNRAATTPSTRQSGGTSASNRAATTPSTRQSGGTSASNRSASSSMGASRNMNSGGYSGTSSMNRSSSSSMSRGGGGGGGGRRR